MRNRLKTLAILGMVFGLLGFGFLLLDGGFFLYRTFFSPNTGTAEGTVTGFASRNGPQAPVVEYTVNGTKYQHTSSVSSSFSLFKRGDRVTIYYDPARPQNSQLSFETGELLSLIFSLIGTGFILVSLVLWVIRTVIQRRSRRGGSG